MDPNKQIEQKLAELESQLAQVKTKLSAPGQHAAVNIDQIAKDVNAIDDKRRAAEAASLRQKLVQPRATAALSTASRILHISRRLTQPDELAMRALDNVRVPLAKSKSYENTLAFIKDKGLGSALTRLSSSLNGSGSLDETNRLLLADPDVFAAVLLPILEDAEARGALDKLVSDKEGFRVALIGKLEEDDGPRHAFVRALVGESLKRSGMKFDESTMVGKRLVEELRGFPVGLGTGKVQAAVEAAHEKIVGEGFYPRLVDAFVDTRDEVDARKFTPEIRSAMVRHLIARGVTIDLDKPEHVRRFAEGGYDEYFAVAYEQAVSSAAGDEDPVVAASTKGASVAAWDFTVDTFDSMEEQGVVKENILAAGALDYIYELGERLGIYRLVDALTLQWAAGAIDVVDGPCAAKMYRYWKMRDQRMDPAERGLVYKRVLNKGETEALDRMVVNENFEALWGTLCEKVAEYRAKVEDAKVEQGDTLLVSRTPIYQAIRDLQYNLTEFSTGMAHMQVREMYSQLREAMDLLADPEIVDHFAGGRRKTMWTAIERLSKVEYGEAPNINAIRIAAVEGNAVFRFIANFQQGSVVEEDFQRFIEAAEAWIIAKGSDTGFGAEAIDEEETGDAEEDDEFAEEEI